MKTQELLEKFPTRRIKPDDGMAVTADVWEEAHEHHRQSQGLLTLFSRGTGILTGLQVMASDPSDTSVYISPGIAVDETGQIIVLTQPVAYDIGQDQDGLLYLLLSHSESRPRRGKGEAQEGAPRYIVDEFSITAQSTQPATPSVELARVKRSSRNAVFLDAVNPAQPSLDELDLRYRREVGAPRETRIAVSYLGQIADKNQGLGISYLAQALNHSGNHHILVEDNVPVGPGIVNNTVVYLVGQGNFELTAGIMNGLRNYVYKGQGTLLIESLDQAAEAVFMEFLKTKDMLPDIIQPGHRLLISPNLFAAPPSGFVTQGNPKLLFSEGVIFSTHNYGLLWQGQREGRAASREEIRSAMEWGANILAYAQSRQKL